ncbi:MAG: hypothetical protein U9R79_21775 [Armatimonadota bacterium]|nr:hypothetical protein [Armatimonadota bacterium]
MYRLRRMLAVVGLSALAWGAWAAPVVTPAQVRRLIVMEDAEVAPVLARRVAWPGGGRLVVAGWRGWPDVPAIIVHGAELDEPWLPEPCSPPRMAISHSGDSIVYWRRAQEGGALLCSLSMTDGRALILDPQHSCAAPGELVALADGSVAAACQHVDEATEIRRFIPGRPSVVLARLPQPTCDALAAADEGCLVVACPGTPPPHYRIDLETGLWAEIDAPPKPLDGAGLPPDVEFDRERAELARRVDGERVVLAEDVRAVAASPSGGALLFAAGSGLWVVDLSGQIKRRLWGAEAPADAAPVLVSWSDDGVMVAHGYRSGDAGTLRLAVLGTEEVTVRLRFAEGSTVRPGSRIWVAERFTFDAAGLVIEPVWGTLKALLVAEEVVRAEEGLICTARSEGLEGGVVERLTGSNAPPPGSEGGSRISIGLGGRAPTHWLRTFTADPLEGLAGWAEGDRVVGTLLSVTVKRRRLDASGH